MKFYQISLKIQKMRKTFQISIFALLIASTQTFCSEGPRKLNIVSKEGAIEFCFPQEEEITSKKYYISNISTEIFNGNAKNSIDILSINSTLKETQTLIDTNQCFRYGKPLQNTTTAISPKLLEIGKIYITSTTGHFDGQERNTFYLAKFCLTKDSNGKLKPIDIYNAESQREREAKCFK